MYYYLKIIFTSFIVMCFISLYSCKKSTDQNSKTENQDDNNKMEMVTVDENDVSESNEDLLTVDYKQFYDELAPHGEWVQVSPKDVGLEMKSSSLIENPEQNHSLLSYLTGVKNANASADVDLGLFFVWRPSPNIAVGVTAGETAPYVPYSNGQWVYTDAGWYFKAATPFEETTCHYGRWVYSPEMGWVWLPGRVWAPSWVVMRESDDYIAWTPVPPGIYFVNNVFTVPVIDDPYRYVIVEKRYFIEPSVYKYKYMYHENKNKIMIKEMKMVDGMIIQNKTIINKGPGVVGIEKSCGKKIEMVKIKKVGSQNDVKYTSTEYDVFSPKFTKVKSTGKVKNTTVSSPGSYKNFSDVKGSKETKESKKENGETGSKEINKEKETGKEKQEKTKEVHKPGKGPGENEKGKLGKEKGETGKDNNEKGKENKGKNKDAGDDPSKKDKGNKNSDKGPKEHGPKGKK